MDFMPGVAARSVETARTRTHFIETGPEDGTPVVMVHGNLSTGRFFEHIMTAAPDGCRIIAPDMRGFGDSEPKPIDATRGLKDWADDIAALVDHLGIDQPVHLAGWSTGGAAIAEYAIARPDRVTSLTFIAPVSPFGFGATKDAAGTPTFDDFAGSGGGAGNPDFAQRLADGDTSMDADVSPRSVMRTSYWSPSFQMDSGWEDMLVAEVLKSVTGDDGYPGDATASDNWPGFAPGTRGILNALSGKYCNWSSIVAIDPKPPILWTHGTDDIVISNASPWEMGTLGQLGIVPGWPGPDVYPPQPQVDQIRHVLADYSAAGGSVQSETFDGSGHGPHIDAADRWREVFFGFVEK